jgi:hypothetical protein
MVIEVTSTAGFLQCFFGLPLLPTVPLPTVPPLLHIRLMLSEQTIAHSVFKLETSCLLSQPVTCHVSTCLDQHVVKFRHTALAILQFWAPLPTSELIICLCNGRLSVLRLGKVTDWVNETCGSQGSVEGDGKVDQRF